MIIYITPGICILFFTKNVFKIYIVYLSNWCSFSDMKRQNVRTLSLIVCTFTYLLIGAAVFDALESENEINLKNELLQHEKKMIEKFNISEEDFEKIRINVLHSKPYKAGVQWKFSGALYFSLLVVSLIGINKIRTNWIQYAVWTLSLTFKSSLIKKLVLERKFDTVECLLHGWNLYHITFFTR